MNVRRPKKLLKREARYRRKKNKEYITNCHILMSLAKSDGFEGGSTHASIQGKIAAKNISKLLLFLCMMTLIRGVGGNKIITNGKTFSKVNLVVGQGATLEECEHVTESLNRITQQLPESREMINNAVKNNHFTCLARNNMASEASYDPTNNNIVFAATNIKQTVKKDMVIHHEIIHSDTHRRHNTIFCNLFFSESQKNQLKKIHQVDNLKQLTPSPIWPPSVVNMNIFDKIIQADLRLNKISKLVELHFNNYHHIPVTKKDQDTYYYYLKLLENTLPVSYTIGLKNDLYVDILIYVAQHQELPEKIMLRNGLICEDVKILTDSEYRATVSISSEDKVSAFLFHHYFAMEVYQSPLTMRLISQAEVDTHQRTGISNAAIEEFYPNLWEHLQREEDCCDKGLLNRCYPNVF